MLKYAGHCHYCRRHVGTANLQMDHLKPMSAGGGNTRENVVPACSGCNGTKSGHRDPDVLSKREFAHHATEAWVHLQIALRSDISQNYKDRGQRIADELLTLLRDAGRLPSGAEVDKRIAEIDAAKVAIRRHLDSILARDKALCAKEAEIAEAE